MPYPRGLLSVYLFFENNRGNKGRMQKPQLISLFIFLYFYDNQSTTGRRADEEETEPIWEWQVIRV
jgi:hypothetical protein